MCLFGEKNRGEGRRKEKKRGSSYVQRGQFDRGKEVEEKSERENGVSELYVVVLKCM